MGYPEILLWRRLRGAPTGIRFRRRHPVGPDYTVDFYGAAARLALAVDGEIHSTAGASAYDTRRESSLRSHGLNVVRVPAADTLRNADEAAGAIVALASAPLHHRPAADGPPPPAGEDQGIAP